MQRNIKCEVVGDGAVGKTCFLFQYTTNNFPGEYMPTTFDTYASSKIVDSQIIQLTLYDTPGQEDYETLRASTYPDTDVFIMCFALDNHSSYENIREKWHPEIRRYCPHTPLILVGLKKDLRDDQETISKLNKINRKPITHQQGLALSAEIGALIYLECSAIKSEGLDEVFNEVVKATLPVSKRSPDNVFNIKQRIRRFIRSFQYR